MCVRACVRVCSAVGEENLGLLTAGWVQPTMPGCPSWRLSSPPHSASVRALQA